MRAFAGPCTQPAFKGRSGLTCWPPLTLALLPLLCSVAWAQTPPDAGSLRQQIEQQRQPTLPQAAPQTPASPPPEIRPADGLQVQVKAFRLAGNTLLSAEQLTPALAGFVDRELDFAALQRASDAVAAAYREAGWLVRVYLPEQDVSEGTITLQVVEARFAGVRLEGSSPSRVRPRQLQALFEARQAIGQPLNANALDRALLLADDLPGVGVSGTLAPGAADGETALLLQTTDEAWLYGHVALDNTGARSTGSARVSASLNINSPLGRGDALNLYLLAAEGSQYARLGMSSPVGGDGLRLGLSGSSMRYKVIEGTGSNPAAQVQGNSSSLGADLNYPLVRQRLHNLNASVGLELKDFYNRDTAVRSDYRSTGLSLGLSGNRFDSLGGGGATSASLQWQSGRLSSLRAHNQIASLARSYSKISYSLSRQQTVTAEHSLLLSLQGQQASQLLDSSEKFFIGGANSVRAYPGSEAGGERGHVLSAEWRWRLDGQFTLSGFVDSGAATALAEPAVADSTTRTLRLHGYGASVQWQGPRSMSLRATLARRIGENPRPTASGTDGDGTLKTNRLWLTASLPF
ncbi:ShlB/FhaC/HecB family hemolysin secretion/activation protein [Limnohabitans sp.]|uniref:ShlB/FhaC/HecB family hemolysin secretion/activation protein n=1 Tax=Limnohabitans sp. TaxID=1907725 RepID=UPI0031FC4126